MFFEDVSTEEEAVNTINDVLSELGLSETPAATEEGASSVKGCDSVQDPLCSLQMSETQSQSVDGTEPVMQAEDVPLQLLLEDKRKRKKQEDFDKKMAARLQKGSDVPNLTVLLMALNLLMLLISRLGIALLLRKTCRVALMAWLSP